MAGKNLPVTPLQRLLSRSSTLPSEIFDNWMTSVTLLICKGARIDLVQSKVPEWVSDLISSRKNCKKAALLLLGMKRFRLSEVMRINGKDAVCLIAKHVVSTQIHPAWRYQDT